MVSDLDVACSVDGCERPKRLRGPECRQCYKVQHKRGRRAQRRFEGRMVSLDAVEYQLNRKWYDLWEQEQD